MGLDEVVVVVAVAARRGRAHAVLGAEPRLRVAAEEDDGRPPGLRAAAVVGRREGLRAPLARRAVADAELPRAPRGAVVRRGPARDEVAGGRVVVPAAAV